MAQRAAWLAGCRVEPSGEWISDIQGHIKIGDGDWHVVRHMRGQRAL